ncbi:MAG: hypothetical protein A2W93_04250 [Bacteroidetes bacterium GWF2_43_63]|nr:MAG: hypothetical protein A2W94_05960 [Bacteroidetes bacterium GWE2_42_42]OFY54394.1 MAG: hypothetical protein A2W93_04250 [Bacteroidetes bacterium GWF2_43_63]HBG69216.1 exonuclease [Bacteroidales bacterium]HCB61229.1 exonuclease [Bacteroidales bacterium]HCY24148.1 exonuclease [Bacteroidales bacterium]
MKYAVCDIETTGGNNRAGKITEIAIFLVEDGKIIDEFSSLINPERPIPPFITQLTGITDAMVEDAPKFYEVAARIVEITKDAIFVAHNVSFDYNFIVTEFARLGYVFKSDKFCTLANSRKLIPGHASYSLGNLCESLNIPLHDRHRAAGDARATVDLFLMLEEIGIPDSPKVLQTQLKLHPALMITRFREIPETTGVYYFYNDKDDLIYIGKSTNLHRRVLDHFYNKKAVRDLRMQELTARVEYEETGSELIALLKESHEIKMNKPVFNRAGRRSLARFGLYECEDNNGYLNFYIDATQNQKKAFPLRAFSEKDEALQYLDRIINRYQLCQKLCGIYDTEGPCFYHQIKKCKGACVGKESPEDYNERAYQALDDVQMKNETFLLSEGQYVNDKKPFVLVENGTYKGYGFLPEDASLSCCEECYMHIQKPAIIDKDAHSIIQSFMRQKKYKLVRFEN